MRALMCVLAGWLCWTGPALAQGQPVEQGIVVTGEGRVSLPPDMVTIRLGVAQSGKTASGVMAEVTQAAAGIQQKLAALGIPPEDRQTSGFYLHPVHKEYASSATPKITGYRAGNTLTVRVRDLALSGQLLDEVIAIGANNFNGLSFSLQDADAALATARANAVADAKARATQLAKAAGISLGPVLRISENSHHGGPVVMEMSARSASMQDAISGGEVDVVASVTMVFAIGPAGQ